MKKNLGEIIKQDMKKKDSHRTQKIASQKQRTGEEKWIPKN